MYEAIECGCGQQARIVICGVGAYIHCTHCGRETYMCQTKEKAIELFKEQEGEKHGSDD